MLIVLLLLSSAVSPSRAQSASAANHAFARDFVLADRANGLAALRDGTPSAFPFWLTQIAWDVIAAGLHLENVPDQDAADLLDLLTIASARHSEQLIDAMAFTAEGTFTFQEMVAMRFNGAGGAKSSGDGKLGAYRTACVQVIRRWASTLSGDLYSENRPFFEKMARGEPRGTTR